MLHVPYGVKDLSSGPFSEKLDQFLGSQHPWEVGVVVSFGYRIPSGIISHFSRGALNMHPSALPRHRGAAPIPHTLLAGDTSTAISIIELHPTRMDAGKLLAQEHLEIEEGEGCVALTAKLAQHGADAVMRTLGSLEECRSRAVAQDERGATRAPKLKAEQGRINWMNHSAVHLGRMSRAFEGSIGLHTELEKVSAQGVVSRVRVNLFSLSPLPAGGTPPGLPCSQSPPGTLMLHKQSKSLWVKCMDAWAVLGGMQVHGRKAVSGFDFAMGLRAKGEGFVVIESARLV